MRDNAIFQLSCNWFNQMSLWSLLVKWVDFHFRKGFLWQEWFMISCSSLWSSLFSIWSSVWSSIHSQIWDQKNRTKTWSFGILVSFVVRVYFLHPELIHVQLLLYSIRFSDCLFQVWIEATLTTNQFLLKSTSKMNITCGTIYTSLFL